MSSPKTTSQQEAALPAFVPASIDMGSSKRKMSWRERWEDSKGMLLILCAETFGTGMAAATRLLEMGGQGMTTLQIMLVRFVITLVLTLACCYWIKIPDFPFGKKEVRWLLVLRGLGGSVGAFGFYRSLEYLSVAEAILISFMSPLLTAYACSIFLHAPFDKKQLLAGVISFVGVILIAQPGPLAHLPGSHYNTTHLPEEVSGTPAQRLEAVLWGLLSILGGTCAYTTIRIIGTRAHTLISVNYYAMIATCISGFILFVPIFPNAKFRLPHGVREWGLLIGVGVSGFCLQWLMTLGLIKDKSSRATNMFYSSVVFGLIADYALWGTVPGWLSWVGGAIVTAATVWGSMQSGEVDSRKIERGGDEEYAMVPGDEMLLSDDDDDDGDDDLENDLLDDEESGRTAKDSK